MSVERIAVEFLAKVSGFRGPVQTMVNDLTGLNRAVSTVEKAALGLGVGIMAGYAPATKMAATFQATLANVNTILGANSKRLGEFGDEILDLATKVPKSANDLAQGAYSIASAGFTKADDVTKVLNASARAAVAGLTSTETAATAVVTALNTYNLSASEAGRVSDILFQAVQVGQFNFEQLATNLNQFLGPARAAGATMEETAAAFAEMSVNSGSVERSATNLTAIFRQLSSPSEDLQRALNALGPTLGMTGEVSGQAAIKQLGLQGTVRALVNSVHGQSAALRELFPEQEAFNGAIFLTARSLEQAEANLAKFTDKSQLLGTTNKALATQSQTVSYQWDQFKTAMGALSIQMGQILLPALKSITSAATMFAQAIQGMPKWLKTAMAWAGFLSGALLSLGAAFLLLYGKVKLVTFAWGLMKSAQNTLNANWATAQSRATAAAQAIESTGTAARNAAAQVTASGAAIATSTKGWAANLTGLPSTLASSYKRMRGMGPVPGYEGGPVQPSQIAGASGKDLNRLQGLAAVQQKATFYAAEAAKAERDLAEGYTTSGKAATTAAYATRLKAQADAMEAQMAGTAAVATTEQAAAETAQASTSRLSMAMEAAKSRAMGMKSAILGTAAAMASWIPVIGAVIIGLDMWVNKKHDEKIDKLERSLRKLPDSIKPGDLEKKLGDIDSLANKIGKTTDLSGWEKGFRAMGTGIQSAGWKKDIDDIDKSLARLFARDPTKAKQQFQILRESLSARGIKGSQIDEAFNDYKNAVDDAGDSASGVTPEIQALIDEINGSAGAAANATDPTEKLAGVYKSLGSGIAQVFQGTVGTALNKISAAHRKTFNSNKKDLKDTRNQALETEKAYLGIERAQLSQVQAQRELDRLDAAYRARKLAQALTDVQSAYDDVTRSVFGVIDAERALEDARTRQESGRSITEAQYNLTRAYNDQAQAAADVQRATEKLAEAQDHGTPEELAQSQRELSEANMRQSESVWAVSDAQTALARANEDAAGTGRAVAEAQLGINEAQRQQAASVESVRAAQQALADLQDFGLMEEQKAATFALRDAIIGAKDAVEALAKAQKEDSKSGADSFDENLDLMKVSVKELNKYLEEQITAQMNWGNNLGKVAEHYGPLVANELQKMGIEGANIVNEMANNISGDTDRLAGNLEKNALYGSEKFQQGIAGGLTKTVGDSRVLTAQMVAAMATELGLLPDQAKTIMEKYGMVLAEGADMRFVLMPDGSVSIRAGKEDTSKKYAAGGSRVFAKGGVLDGNIASKPTVIYGERETGEELFLPKRGISKKRAMGLLNTAAGWYDGSVNYMAEGGVLPYATDFDKMYASFGVEGRRAANLVRQRMTNLMAAAAATQAGVVSGIPQAAGANQDAVRRAARDRGWDSGPQWDALYQLVAHESGWRNTAQNPTSTAYGLFQFLNSTWAGTGIAKTSDPYLQGVAGLRYIANRADYRTPSGAYAKWLSRSPHWYAKGGILNPYIRDFGGDLMPGFTFNGTGMPERVMPPDKAGAGCVVNMRVNIDAKIMAELGEDTARRFADSVVKPMVNQFETKVVQLVTARR